MQPYRTARSLLTTFSLATSTWAEWPKPNNPRWKPIADAVYLQEVGRQITTDR